MSIVTIKRSFKNTYFFIILVIISLLSGCMSSIKVIIEDGVTIEEYGEFNLLAPEQDPRNIFPGVVNWFNEMGYNVRVIDPNEPIGGTEGTGFVISMDGLIATCAHVLNDDPNATVWLNGKRYEADVLYKDDDADVAILQINNENVELNPVSFRSHSDYKLGEDVFTIGFPMSNLLGDSARLNNGLISATKGLKDDPNHVQISVEVQPGNSGGPLFNKDGTVIGIVQATVDPLEFMELSRGALPQNLNFAIKSGVILESINKFNPDIYKKLYFDKTGDFDELAHSVVKVRSGIMPDELEEMPKVIVVMDYDVLWDLWYRFNYFVLLFFDFDSAEPLFAVGQIGDNIVSNEDIVVKSTLAKVKKVLEKAKTSQE